ncbi:MAG: PIG-L family deacetylase [Roseibium sp.]
MPLTDPQRIARDAEHPHIVDLWRALAPLRSVISFMNTGAHPDDEISDMLAAMSFRDGIDVSCACSTRGEGGQNDIGREATETLGVLRTAEMERAADRLNMRLYWLSESPTDTIFDFGFSKSGIETLAKWGKDRTLKRFVDILREEKPDIICPTFLDVPGQHGHHRAMTEAAEDALHLAADPNYRDSDLPVWDVSKLYLPAWSGAGQAYDDDLPPPPATLVVSGEGFDPVTGFTYGRIGEQSRVFHRTQAMGKWLPPAVQENWPLHLKYNRTSAQDKSVGSGLPTCLADLGSSADLARADQEIASALAAFPDSTTILRYAGTALSAMRAGADSVDPRFAHKITRKETQLAHLIRIAARVECRARLDRDILTTTDATKLQTEFHRGDADAFRLSVELPDGWKEVDGEIQIHNAPASDPYPSRFLPGEPAAPCIKLSLTAQGIESETTIPLEVPPQVLPEASVAISPSSAVVNHSAKPKPLHLKLSSITPAGSNAALILPDGWISDDTSDGFEVTIPDDVKSGLYTIGLTLDGKPAQTVQSIAYPHISPRHLIKTAEVSVRVVDAGMVTSKIGYIGAGHDRVDYWLENLGLNVTVLDADMLGNEAALSAFDTIVIGIFAMKFRDGLADALPSLHHWVNSGGTLVTLYHRPWDNWDPDTTPPAHLEIGQPSLRWRVTDENSTVTHLVPDHPLVTNPNAIEPEDWSGWHKERGLYFAKNWDLVYQPLVEMADPDEAPHKGALLSADIGKGRHIHCALILHHQMEKLAPGAFKLMMNMVSPRT